MTKINAKQLLVGKVFSTFILLISDCIVSAIGLFSAIAVPLYTFSEKAINSFHERFGEYALALRIALCIVAVAFGLFLFSLGRNLKAKKIYDIISDEKAVCSVKKSFQFLLCYAVKFLFMLCWSFVYLLPCVLSTSFLMMSLSQGAMEKNIYYSWVTGNIVLFLLGVFFIFVTLQRYSAWSYYLCREDGSVISSLYKSIDKTDDRCLEIAFFKISMFGWILSCLLVLPLVYVVPYYNVSAALCAIGKTEIQAEKKREEIPPAVFRIIRN